MQGWSSRKLLLTWALAGVLLYVVAPNLPFIAAIMVGPLVVLAAPVHVVFGLFLVGLFIVRHGNDWRRKGLLIVSPILAFAALIGLAMASSEILSWSGFLLDLPGYKRVIAQLERGETPPRGPVRYTVEGEPLRVVFPTQEGFVDNWAGVVYDPTDQVRARKVDPKVRKWFGGDMVGCTHLTGHFYRCGFT